MKPLMLKKLPRGKLTTLFIAVAVVSIVTLVWMGVRLVRQDRILEAQRLEELREQTADRFVASLTEAIEELQTKLGKNPSVDSLVQTGDTLIVEASSKAVQVLPERSLLYYPVIAEGRKVSLQLFRVAERAEFVDRDFDRAIETLRKVAQVKDPVENAAAKIRLARNLRKAGRINAALKVYEELAGSANPQVLISGVPVELVARAARCRTLQELGDHDRLKSDAGELYQGLEAGRWPLDRPSFDYYAGQVDRWIGRTPGADALRRALAEVVARVWDEWMGRQNNERESASCRAMQIHSTCMLVVTRTSREHLVALVGGPRFQEHRLFNPPLEKFEFTGVQITPNSEEVIWNLGSEPSPRDVATVRFASTTGLPWDLVLTGATFEEELSQFAQRRQLMATGLGILVLFLIASSYLICRSIRKELAAARLQSDFVSAVSHEFRTPLTSMRQFTEMLLEDDGLTPAKRKSFYRAQERSTRRLSRLVESLLDFGRMEAGARPYRFETLDVGKLVRNVVEEFRAEPAFQDFVIDCTIPEDRFITNGDEEGLARALWNLLDNAAKYSGTSREIKVQLGKDRHIRIDVRDQGVGIEASDTEQLFRKFTRGSSARDLGIKGTGIGLAMVKHIVEAHGGSVLVNSEPGRGSTFTVELPDRGGS